ncbi:hypothetical protein ACQFX9_26595 [Aliinostoc sp. HNIBRCY26]|uniref:hypothetical protein n=1 Tax=Aliinostoc sp. HNIBRCY26 TaxID=3418997 RepID=UPI003D030B50
MPVKLKFFLILMLSVIATAGAGVYLIQHQTAMPIPDTFNTQPPQQLSPVQQTQAVVEDVEREKYQNMPLENLNSILQGSDPIKLAQNFLDDVRPSKGDRKIEVEYPQPHQSIVTVIQKTKSQDATSEVMRYRLEMNSFGRSLLSSSPPIWRIVWVGSQVQCPTKNLTKKNNPKLKTPTKPVQDGFDKEC